ncbi:MAG: hypothetical protein WAL83_05925 [Arenicellales bacterium]
MLKERVLFASAVGLVSVSAVSPAEDEAVIKCRRKVVDVNGANQGAMAEAIDGGYRFLSGEDRQAIAEYILSLPPIRHKVK